MSAPNPWRSTPSGANATSSLFTVIGNDVTILDKSTPLQVIHSDQMAQKKGGQEKGGIAYTAAEHFVLLSILPEEDNAFNTIESFLQWVAVVKMGEESYSLNPPW